MTGAAARLVSWRSSSRVHTYIRTYFIYGWFFCFFFGAGSPVAFAWLAASFGCTYIHVTSYICNCCVCVCVWEQFQFSFRGLLRNANEF